MSKETPPPALSELEKNWIDSQAEARKNMSTEQMLEKLSSEKTDISRICALVGIINTLTGRMTTPDALSVVLNVEDTAHYEHGTFIRFSTYTGDKNV